MDSGCFSFATQVFGRFFFIWVKECFLFFPRPEMGKKRIFNKNLCPLLLPVSLPHQEQPQAFMKAETRRKGKKSTKRREKKKRKKERKVSCSVLILNILC